MMLKPLSVKIFVEDLQETLFMAVAPSPIGAGSHLDAPPARPPKFRHSFWWYLKWFFYSIALVVFCVVVAVASVGYGLYKELEKVV
ncbi:MAG TPA: hypothetical protein VGB77_05980, partial [Abditibacteriaceae bacterium]